MASDDQEVEAWYLEGWCFYLMAEQARESGQKIEDLTWEELAKDSRDCLETCKTVRILAYIDSVERLYFLTNLYYLAARRSTTSRC